MNIVEITEKFDSYLTKHEVKFEGILVGGAALVLLKVIDRSTRDFDLMQDTILPEKVVELARSFARENNLPEDWLNNGPAALRKDLPPGWETRLVVIFEGNSLTFKGLHRSDTIKAKVWALCDRMRDLPDVIALKPSLAELKSTQSWLYPLDANPGWKNHVDTVIEAIKDELGYD